MNQFAKYLGHDDLDQNLLSRQTHTHTPDRLLYQDHYIGQ